MQQLAQQRCFTHWQREAAARCPDCARYFCRECITEHEGRVVCAGCLKKLVQPAEKKERRPLRFLWRALQVSFGILLLWMFFYYLGQVLLSIPSSYHEGKYWEKE